MNIFDAIDQHVAVRPFDVAVVHPRGSVNYLQLQAVIAAAAARLRAQGVEPGSTVAVYVADPFLHLTLVLALMLNGTASVSAHPNRDPIPAALKADVYLADADMQVPSGARLVRVDAEWARAQAQMPFPRVRGFADPDAICRIIASSGTTGTEKAVAHSSRGLEAMALHHLSLDGSYAIGPNISLMSLSTFGGFSTAHSTLWAGATLVFAVGERLVLRAINLYQIRTLSASPVQLQSLVALLDGGGARFPSLRQLRYGGSTLPLAVARRASALLCPNIVGVYASTEVGLAAYAPAPLVESRPGIAGYLLPGVAVRIVDEAGNVLGSDRQGIVHIRTPHMALGYCDDPAATRKAFQDGWFIPGDIGSLSPDGLLTIHGRAAELINAGGVKVSPQVIDEVLLTLPGVRDAAAFAMRGQAGTDQIWAAIVTDGLFDEAALRRACFSRLNSRAPVRFIQVAELPRNAMGKIQREKLSAAAAAG